MASHPVVHNPLPGDAPLSVEQGWELIFESFGSAKELYAELGGGEAWLRAERAAWGEETTA